MFIPIIVLAAVFVLIAIRKVGNVRFQIWQIMLFGAIAVLVTGQISPLDALKSINFDVILFLFGMFIVGVALEESGYLYHLTDNLFKRAKSSDELILFVLFGMGIASAFLMNDTIAIIGTPVVLLLAKKHDMSAKLLLFSLAFAVTIGSTMSPIGNPQNLLVAINGNVGNPFLTFFKFLFMPTIINLLIAFAMLKLFYRNDFHKKHINNVKEAIKDEKLKLLSKISLILIVLLAMAKIMTFFVPINIDFKLTYMALIAALPIIAFSERRIEILKKVDWYTLIFFAAMFILMESVWETGFFQFLISESKIDVTSTNMILLVSVVVSQFISNVPLVALYLPLLQHFTVAVQEMIALAAGSTIAGNLSILGAASNIIIIQNAERRSRETMTFIEFAKIGIPLTILNVAVYWLFLSFI